MRALTYRLPPVWSFGGTFFCFAWICYVLDVQQNSGGGYRGLEKTAIYSIMKAYRSKTGISKAGPGGMWPPDGRRDIVIVCAPKYSEN
jgi:hypothetical protein